jgi:hypothetical protein
VTGWASGWLNLVAVDDALQLAGQGLALRLLFGAGRCVQGCKGIGLCAVFRAGLLRQGHQRLGIKQIALAAACPIHALATGAKAPVLQARDL